MTTIKRFVPITSLCIKSIFVFCVCLFLSSCGAPRPTVLAENFRTTYEASISSFGNYNMRGKTFYIESGDKNISSNDLEFREYAKYISESLKQLGGIEATDRTNADLCILINYGIFDKSYSEIVPVPVWGRTGISAIYTTSNTTISPFGGSATTSSVSTVIPSYGIAGYTSESRNVAQFRRVLNVYAYDNKRRGKHDPIMLWKTNVVSDGSSNDLRHVIPYMAFLTIRTMGTDGNKKLAVFEDDYLVQCFKQEIGSNINNDYLCEYWKKSALPNSGVTLFPKAVSTNADKIYIYALAAGTTYGIDIVEKKSDETIVVFRKSGVPWSYYISPEMYIEYNGQKYQIKSVDGYELGSKIKTECGTRYFRLHFPPIPSNATVINILDGVVSEGVESGCGDCKIVLTWNGLKIK